MVRVFNPVLVIKGAWVSGTQYTGNCIQRDAVKYTGNWYMVRTSVGTTSTTWVESRMGGRAPSSSGDRARLLACLPTPASYTRTSRWSRRRETGGAELGFLIGGVNGIKVRLGDTEAC